MTLEVMHDVNFVLVNESASVACVIMPLYGFVLYFPYRIRKLQNVCFFIARFFRVASLMVNAKSVVSEVHPFEDTTRFEKKTIAKKQTFVLILYNLRTLFLNGACVYDGYYACAYPMIRVNEYLWHVHDIHMIFLF